MSFPFNLPSQSPGGPIPIWIGNGFHVGRDFVSVLEYSSNMSGWTDDLTIMHEETAGSNHFIDQASRQHALEQLRKHVRGENPVVLEVGCSSGFMLRLMCEHLPKAFVMGSDVVRGPLEELAANLPDVPLLRFDLVHCPLPDNSCDAVIMLNVLEHIENDAAAIEQVHRILKPNGIVVIEAPAGPSLYDVYDKLLKHCRRYALSDLRGLVKEANFQIVEQSHLGFFLYPGFWLVKRRNKRFLSQKKALQQRIVEQNIRDTGNSRLLNAIMRIELFLGRWISYPFGIRCLMTCIKVA